MDDDAFLWPGVGGDSRCVEDALRSADPAPAVDAADAADAADVCVGSGVGVALGVHPPLPRLDALSLSAWSARRGGDDSGGADAGLANALHSRILGTAGVAAVGEEERLCDIARGGWCGREQWGNG